MKRHFPNWLEAFEQYSNDDFVPPQFNTWTGLSCIAGALERKVWMPFSETRSEYPNIFVLLVSLPGVGKSTALNRGIGLLQEVVQRGGNMNILPSQITQAKFIELMGEQAPFEYGTKVINQCAGYYFASEASNELTNVYGDFIACLTSFYDCPMVWEKATVKDGKTSLRNVCLNLLAGSTFDYLGKLVTDENIMGGFASRLIYVVQRDKVIREAKFRLASEPTAESIERTKERLEFRKKLVDDLIQINRMIGPFSADPGYAASWEKWYPEFQEKQQNNPSEKMQSLLVRTNTNIFKVSMLLSAAESDDKVLKQHHWEKALALAETNARELPAIFRQAKANDTLSQAGLNQAIFSAFDQTKQMTIESLKVKLMLKGFKPHEIEATVRQLEKGGQFKDVSIGSAGRAVKLITNPDQNF